VEEIEQLSMRRPQLALALLHIAVQRSVELRARIESFSLDKMADRLVRALIHFSERFGQVTEDGSVQMIPLTHALLAQYIGTSREIVTSQMNFLRDHGYLRHSRKGIWLQCEALNEWLKAGRSRMLGSGSTSRFSNPYASPELVKKIGIAVQTNRID
jgi:hypothetical protein